MPCGKLLQTSRWNVCQHKLHDTARSYLTAKEHLLVTDTGNSLATAGAITAFKHLSKDQKQ